MCKNHLASDFLSKKVLLLGLHSESVSEKIFVLFEHFLQRQLGMIKKKRLEKKT